MALVKVKKIIDGDTFQGDNNKFYRLAEVNAPEKKERGYKKATEELRNLIEGEQLVVNTVGKSYSRDVVEVRKRGEKTTINSKMKRKGYK